MSLLPFRRKKKDEYAELHELIERAKQADAVARNQLLEDYIPFIMKITSQATGRYINRGIDDEFSIALSAFNEAIDRFDMDKGANFLGFADTVIKRRLIDYYRAQATRQKDIPFSEFDMDDGEDNVVNYVEVQTSIEAYTRKLETDVRRDEIVRFTEMLEAFDIRLEELVDLSPKHADARQNAMEVARIIAQDEAMSEYLLEKKALPLKLLSSKISVSRKTVERQRKYIISIALILIGDFELLQDYIQ